MIPVTLKLEDFLSYACPDPLDFTGFDVACLVGANGQGKTAIIDAITWALFGAARGSEGGRDQERLIRDGAERACVELTFELGGETYRVRRSRDRRGKGELAFLIRSGGRWTSLAGDSLRATEAEIARVLRMDYRTFTASAFFLQGRADEFLVRMRPEERKEVFARLLDLGIYERLEEAARARAREAEAARRELAARVEALRAELAERPAVEAAREAAREAREAAAEEVARAEGELEARRGELERAERTAELAARERKAVGEAERRLAEEREALADAERELAELGELLAAAERIRAEVAELQRLEAEDARLHELARRHARLEAERAEAEGGLRAAAADLEAQARERAERAASLRRQAAGAETDRRTLESLEREVAETQGIESALSEVREQLARLREEGASLQAALEATRARRAEVGERLQLLGRPGGACPVCGGELTPDHRRRLHAEAAAEAVRLEEEEAVAEARRQEVRKEWRRLSEEERRLAAQAQKREQAVAEAARVRERVDAARTLAAEAEALEREAAAAAARLRDGDYGAEWRARLEAIDAQRASLGYDRSAHDRVRAALAALAPARERAGRLAGAEARLQRVAAERDRLVARVDAEEAELERRRRQLAALEEMARAVGEARRRVEEAAAAVEEARRAEMAASREEGRLAERLASFDHKAAEAAAAADAERERAAEHRRYARLAEAFGRGGIPDLIIENALPELTYEANEVLGVLTDHEMYLQFRMQKETRSGKVRETFDVLVHHDGGVREYQLFSGGEAFRIAFAIRMGLSKLLVRRAGARLETLVIDEGFGSQDAAGRQRLVEAINVARREFRKVLVITHLDELKDAFGAQIVVSKDPVAGSQLRVVCG